MGAVEDLERFSITNSGELILKGNLDYERRIQHSFLVHVTDGHHVRTISPQPLSLNRYSQITRNACFFAFLRIIPKISCTLKYNLAFYRRFI